jgi:hypothetical protein
MELIINRNKPLQSSVIVDERFPWRWEEHKDVEFFLPRMGQYVKLTQDIHSDGTYYVKVLNSTSERMYPVRGHELILADSKEAKKIVLNHQESSLFPINKANWTQIKNFLCDDFINSYPWKGNDSKSSESVRDSFLSLAKSPRSGISKVIENERNQGYFLDRATFASRMKPHLESFPWEKLSEFLDFSEPQT